MRVREHINFERGIDPKDSMDIGNINARKLKSFYDYTKQFKNFKIGELKYPDFEFVIEDPGIEIYIKVIISKNPDDKEDFIYHSYGRNGSALSIDHFTNLAEFEKILKHKVGYAMRESVNFERGVNPKNSMRIGMPTWETVKEGDLVECLQTIPLNNSNIISHFSAVSDLPKGAILEIDNLEDASSKEWVIWYRYFGNKQDFQENKNEHIKERLGYVKGTPAQFKKLFKFLPRSMNEAVNFERGKAPKSTMGIGRKNMIENWLKEQELYEICTVNEDLTIDSTNIVKIKELEDGKLPEFIQFNVVRGGFSVENKGLTTLRGCPKKVLESEDYKGNFKCGSNQLTSLEHSPKLVEGNYLCNNNPGKFKRADVTKLCKVKSGKIWADIPTGYIMPVKEGMGFQRGGDLPLDTLNIGHHSKVLHWFETVIHNPTTVFDEGEDFRINKDGTIDLLGDFSMNERGLESLPPFIRFNIAYGSFYAANNKFTSLEGFPKEVRGDFSIYGTSKKWKENEIRKRIKITGTVWN